MLQKLDELLSSSYEEAILDHFAHKFKLDRTDVPKIFEAIEEYWFVPRSDEMKLRSIERVEQACMLMKRSGLLIDDHIAAYRFSCSERALAIRERVGTTAA